VLHREGLNHGWRGNYNKSYDELAATDPIGKGEFDAIVERMLLAAMRATSGGKSNWSNAPMPKLGKAHSAKMAEEFIRLGWTLKHEFRANSDEEPYEYLFEWQAAGDAVYPDRFSPE
jgi:hypothetical protein